MGPLGWQEMVIIFILALVLFGPKKLPELGRTIGKAITEFRRASNEFKSTFEREMQNLERENESLQQVTQSYSNEIYNQYESGYDSAYDYGAYGSESGSDSTATKPSNVSASASQDAENQAEPSAENGEGVPGTVARGAGPEYAPNSSNGTAAHEPAPAEPEESGAKNS